MKPLVTSCLLLMASMVQATPPMQANLAYGSHPRQTLDVYQQAGLNNAPVIFMVHGGGWAHGDKDMSRVVENKVARWLPRGVVFVSVNYRLLPDSPPDVQLDDIARALAYAQSQAVSWGAERSRFVLMGHSAGAHLVALLASSPAVLARYGATPPVATVSLDSAALDVVAVMSGRHFSLYDRAFGTDRTYWQSLSPAHQLKHKAAPFLLVCSSKRATVCPESERFAAQARGLGGQAEVLPQALSHGDINAQLGTPGAYTEAVERFLHKVAGLPL